MEDNEIPVISDEKFYTIRGKQVMLDSDVAELYHCETKIIIDTVNRNKARFPDDFCFKLTEEEYNFLGSHYEVSNTANINGEKKKIPYVFTEKGILMLSLLLKTKTAVEVSIKIMNDFFGMQNMYF